MLLASLNQFSKLWPNTFSLIKCQNLGVLNTNVGTHSLSWSTRSQRCKVRSSTCPSFNSRRRFFSNLRFFWVQRGFNQRETHSIWCSFSKLLEHSEEQWPCWEPILSQSCLWSTLRTRWPNNTLREGTKAQRLVSQWLMQVWFRC
jgi:hypothetical protein